MGCSSASSVCLLGLAVVLVLVWVAVSGCTLVLFLFPVAVRPTKLGFRPNPDGVRACAAVSGAANGCRSGDEVAGLGAGGPENETRAAAGRFFGTVKP